MDPDINSVHTTEIYTRAHGPLYVSDFANECYAMISYVSFYQWWVITSPDKHELLGTV